MVVTYPGLGITNTQIAQSAITGGVASTAGILMAVGVVGGPIGAAIAGSAALVGLIANAFSGCGNTCVQATSIVNQIEPYLKQNVEKYLAYPTPRPKSVQAAALNVFNTAWSNVEAACGNASLGNAGVKCISDRKRGGKWDWFSYYYDPIATDTNVYDDSVGASVTSSGSNIATGITNTISSVVGGGNMWLWIALLVGGGLLLTGGGRHDS